MEGNKDEALRCIQIAKSAISSGDKQKALKFIKIAKRLNTTIPVDDLLASCENLDSDKSKTVRQAADPDQSNKTSSSSEWRNGEDRVYTDEHVKLIREVKRNSDYYAILGVEKSCSVEEIRRAYKKLSLKVHPDKNKAPGSEEAFKKVCKAFKCLSEEESRRQYDQTGLVEDFEYNQQHNNVRRRRRTRNDFFHDDFDPDEIFRSFFGRSDMFRNADVYRTRPRAEPMQREDSQGGFNIITLVQLLPILAIFLLAYLPFSEPQYALQRNNAYQIPYVTENYGIEFYVKSSDFDQKYPVGSSSRADFEAEVERDYRNMLARYCNVELQRRQWNRKYPTPHCDKLRNLGLA